MQPPIADTEVVGDFVPDDPLNFLFDLIIATAFVFNWLLEDSDFIRRHQPVVTAPLRLGDAFVKTE